MSQKPFIARLGLNVYGPSLFQVTDLVPDLFKIERVGQAVIEASNYSLNIVGWRVSGQGPNLRMASWDSGSGPSSFASGAGIDTDGGSSGLAFDNSGESEIYGAALSITDSTSATDSTTGALKVTGGISTQENLYVGGDLVPLGNQSDTSNVVIGLGSTIGGAFNSVVAIGGTSFGDPTTASASFQTLVGAGINLVGSGTGEDVVLIGDFAYSGGGGNFTGVGSFVGSTGNYSYWTAVGEDISVNSSGNVLIGGRSSPSRTMYATAGNSITIGMGAQNDGNIRGVVIGYEAYGGGGDDTVAIGSFTEVEGSRSIVLGNYTYQGFDSGYRDDMVIIGYGASSATENILQIGGNRADLTLSGASGNFQPGDIITGSVSGATAIVAGNNFTTPLEVAMTSAVDFTGTDNITGSISGDTATVDSVVTYVSNITSVSFNRGVDTISFVNPLSFSGTVNVGTGIGSTATVADTDSDFIDFDLSSTTNGYLSRFNFGTVNQNARLTIGNPNDALFPQIYFLNSVGEYKMTVQGSSGDYHLRDVNAVGGEKAGLILRKGLTVADAVVIENDYLNVKFTKASTDSTTGALTVVGGISTQENLNVGIDLGVGGDIDAGSSIVDPNTARDFRFGGTMQIGDYISNNSNISNPGQAGINAALSVYINNGANNSIASIFGLAESDGNGGMKAGVFGVGRRTNNFLGGVMNLFGTVGVIDNLEPDSQMTRAAGVFGQSTAAADMDVDGHFGGYFNSDQTTVAGTDNWGIYATASDSGTGVFGAAWLDGDTFITGTLLKRSLVEIVTATQGDTILTRESSKKVIIDSIGSTISLWDSAQDGDEVYLRNRSGGSITIDVESPTSGDTIEGSSTFSLLDGESIMVVYDSTTSDWTVF